MTVKKHNLSANNREKLVWRTILETKETKNNSQGGQKTTCGHIARALSVDPEAILFDEGNFSLDPEMVGGTQDYAGIWNWFRPCYRYPWEMEFARDISDRVIFMDKGVIGN